jgi:hypothetical protein
MVRKIKYLSKKKTNEVDVFDNNSLSIITSYSKLNN